MTAPTFAGLSAIDWTALAAISTFALAAATVGIVIATVLVARGDRRRDDRLRHEDRERADQLRREDNLEWERRLNAERREREDYEARQVTVEVTARTPPFESAGHDLNREVLISEPSVYPIKQVDVQVVHWTNSSLAMRPIGHGGDPQHSDSGRTWYRFWADIPERLIRPVVIARFTDRHGNLYYTLGGQTRRFPHDTDWIRAATELDKWLRLGPTPEDGR